MSDTIAGLQARRIRDIEFCSFDKLEVTFKFIADNLHVDLSLTTMTATARANNHETIEQPTVTTDATSGLVTVSWTALQTAVLPSYFQLVLAGRLDSLDVTTTVGEATWDELTDDLTWEVLNGVETFGPTALWDRSVLVARFTRNDAGVPDAIINLNDDPVLVLVGASV